MVRRQVDRYREGHTDQGLFACGRAFTPSELTRDRMNAVHDGVGDRESRIDERRDKGQRPGRAVSSSGPDLDIARRVDPRRDLRRRERRRSARPANVRVAREDVVELDLNLRNAAEGRPAWDQAGEGG